MSYFTRNMDKCSRLHSFPVTVEIKNFVVGHTCTCRADDEESADDNKAIFTSREKGPIKIWQGPCGPTSQDLIKKTC